MRLTPTKSESFAICLTVLAVLAILLDSVAIRRQQNSCAMCRLTRNDYSGPQGRWTEYEETECSQWYSGNIEPEHRHVWACSPSIQHRTIFGTPCGVSDSERPFGFMKLTPTEQIEVYRHIPNVDEANGLFVGMRDDMESHDPPRHRRAKRTGAILRDWADSDFRGTWQSVRNEIGE